MVTVLLEYLDLNVAAHTLLSKWFVSDYSLLLPMMIIPATYQFQLIALSGLPGRCKN